MYMNYTGPGQESRNNVAAPFPPDRNRLDWRSRKGLETTGVLAMADVNQGAPCTPVRSPDQPTPRF
jgi:hypothetical protein